MRKIKRYRLIAQAMRLVRADQAVGVIQYSGRPKISSSKRKKPVTTWLSPIEIAKLKALGGHNAQSGIRTLAKKLVTGGKGSAKK
jgi:cobalamin biosynthesis protein CobT